MGLFNFVNTYTVKPSFLKSSAHQFCQHLHRQTFIFEIKCSSILSTPTPSNLHFLNQVLINFVNTYTVKPSCLKSSAFQFCQHLHRQTFIFEIECSSILSTPTPSNLHF